MVPRRAVVDASVAIKWVVEELGSDRAHLLRSSHLLAPDIILAECANILWKKVRRGEISAEQAIVRTRALLSAGIELVASAPLMAQATALAIALDHPAYDCFYLAVADAQSVPLVTADARLAGAIKAMASSSIEVILLSELTQTA